MKKNLYTKLFYGIKKINLEIVNMSLKDSDNSLFKDGLNVIAIKNDKNSKSYSSFVFAFYENSKTIHLTGIANNVFIKGKKFSSMQLVDTFIIRSYKNKNLNSVIQAKPPLRTISRPNKLKIVKKG